VKAAVLIAPHNTSLVLLLLLTAAAALHDLKTGLIPDRLVLGGLVLALLSRVVLEPIVHSQSALAALGGCLLGAGACAIVPFVLYAAKGLGGGDLKLLTVVGVLVGPFSGMEVQVYAFSLGSLFAFGYLAYRGTLLRTLASSAALLVPIGGVRARAENRQPKLHFRFGPAIFAGALVTALLHWRLA
jgi:prepilin peptidase CpaA